MFVIDLFLGIPSRNTPLRNSRWTRSIAIVLFSPKALSEANFLWLKCIRGAHGQNTGKRSTVSSTFKAFYVGYKCLALVAYKAHIAMGNSCKECLQPFLCLTWTISELSLEALGQGALLQLVVHGCSPELWLQENSVPSRGKHSCFALMLGCQAHVK